MDGRDVTCMVNVRHDAITRSSLLCACRALHQARAVSWNTSIAASAAAYAATCVYEHDPANNVFGENLYVAYASTLTVPRALNDSVEAWYSEVAFYNYSNPSVPTTAGEQVGHFTQLVWASTTSVGCGIMVCPDGVFNLDGTVFWNAPNVHYVVCRQVAAGARGWGSGRGRGQG